MDEILEHLSKALAKSGLSDRAASLQAAGNPSMIRDMRRGHAPSINKVKALSDFLGLEFYIGPPREQATVVFDWTVLGETKAPHHGVARCGVTGWGKDMPDRAPMPLPEAANDSEAFWVTAAGASMKPEGIESNWLCLVSPAREPVPGDRVWLLDINNAASIKRLVSIGNDGLLMLRGWQNVRAGQQKSFNEERFQAGIKRVHPVIAVFRGRPGGDVFEYVPDPKAPSVHPKAIAPPELIDALDLPEGTSMVDAIKAIKERLEEAGNLDARVVRDKLETISVGIGALTDASALAKSRDGDNPPDARPVDVMELASAAGGGAEVLGEEVSGRVWFRRDWLDARGLMARDCVVIGVAGESMEPTLWDDSKILINRADTRRRADAMFVVRTPDGLVVKRAGKDPQGNWLLVSDHSSWEDVAWPDDSEIIGRVMWTARSLA